VIGEQSHARAAGHGGVATKWEVEEDWTSYPVASPSGSRLIEASETLWPGASVRHSWRLRDKSVLLRLLAENGSWRSQLGWWWQEDIPFHKWKGVRIAPRVALAPESQSEHFKYAAGSLDESIIHDASSADVDDSEVTHLDLSKVNLQGTIPECLGQLTGLRILRLNDNQLTGSIPDSFRALTNLVELTFHNNMLTGSVPSDALSNLTRLRKFKATNNQLVGLFPENIRRIPGPYMQGDVYNLVDTTH
jgi:Leucine-rich repeat (LRR) protein